MSEPCDHCGRYDRPDLCVEGVMFDRSGNVLALQRAIEPRLGEWTLPGGHVNVGEHPATAAEREFLEETGLLTRVVDPLHVYLERSTNRIVMPWLMDSDEWLQNAEIGGGVRIDAESSAYGWLSPRECYALSREQHIAVEHARTLRNR